MSVRQEFIHQYPAELDFTVMRRLPSKHSDPASPRQHANIKLHELQSCNFQLEAKFCNTLYKRTSHLLMLVIGVMVKFLVRFVGRKSLIVSNFCYLWSTISSEHCEFPQPGTIHLVNFSPSSTFNKSLISNFEPQC